MLRLQGFLALVEIAPLFELDDIVALFEYFLVLLFFRLIENGLF